MDNFTRIVADADPETRPVLLSRRAALAECVAAITLPPSERARIGDRIAAIDAGIAAIDAVESFGLKLFRSEVSRVR